MPLDLLHFGSGVQALHYFVLCFFAILGILQAVAAFDDRRDLIWLKGVLAYVLAASMVIGAFAWFFWADEEIFMPGLAGGELFVLFLLAFILAVPTARLVRVMLFSHQRGANASDSDRKMRQIAS